MIEIHHASSKDLDLLTQFQCLMAKETENLILDPAVVKKGVDAILLDSNKGTYYIAKVQNTVAGCLLITPEWSDWRNGTVLWIQSVYVDKAFRQQGVFRTLYNYVQDQVNEDPSLMGIRLYVEKENASAQNVYSGIGMNGDHYHLFEWMKN